jgi:hypothetical protein
MLHFLEEQLIQFETTNEEMHNASMNSAASDQLYHLLTIFLTWYTQLYMFIASTVQQPAFFL